MLEWYTLDSSLRRDQVIEGFQSFIWTERWQDAGDFQIVIKSTYQNRQLLQPETLLAMNQSKRIMKVDTVSDVTDQNGVRNLTVTGFSLEALLKDRVAMPAITDTTTTPNWVITDTPANIIRYMFNQICVACVLSGNDTIPFYHSGTLLPAGSIPEDSDPITVTAAPDTLFNTIQKLAQAYFLGFRLVRNGDAGEIYFEVYTGNDLTSDQTVRSPVIFDPNMDNLGGVSLLTSTAAIKTVAYVYAQNGSAVVYSPTANPDATGLDRRVLLVNSSNSDPAGPDLSAALAQEGLLALTNQRTVYAFDGQLPQEVPYAYGVDYNLGDLVEERNSDGFGNQMYVTEQIFSSDNTGEKQYPTLTVAQVITPGSWLSFDPSVHWTDEDPTVNWTDL
jgi:hypothetical protein